MIKKIVTSIMAGIILGFIVELVGFSSIIVYGLTHAPWHFHLSLASGLIIDFISNADGSFSENIGSGLLGITVIIGLAVTAAALLLQAVFRPQTKHFG